FVTHRVNSEKKQRIKTAGISAIEIDLSSAPRDLPIDSITELVVNRVDNKYWLYNSFMEREYRKILSTAIKKPCIYRGLAIHVDFCPIKIRIWRGKFYANVIDDCIYCEYCLEVGQHTSYIRCNGHLANSSII
ncbi:hypothetical protein VU05_04130, partial [Desulfobulbus sp. F1]|nr:hypothetical protein [Desulfobulbus sp. F1]